MRSNKRPNAALAVAALALLFAGIATYGFAIGLPLFGDDLVHFRWLQRHDLQGIWSTSRQLGYYRPIPFTVWKALWLCQGDRHPPTLHALNVGLHLLNAFLVLRLVMSQRREGGLLVGFSSAFLFLLYPFSYQAVPWVGSLTHPLVTALILSSLLMYRASTRHHSRLLMAGSAGLALLAPFAHETGILITPLLFLLLLTNDEPIQVGEALRRTALHGLCAALGLAAWLWVPKGLGRANVLNLESRWQNGVYFLQGLAYPVSPLAKGLMAAGWGLDDLQSIALVTVPVVSLWSLLLWKAGRGKLVALALGWFVLSVAPAWLILGFAYIVDGPRLLYEASVGAALLWAIPMSLRWSGRLRQIVGMALAVAVVISTGFSGYVFVHARSHLYEQIRLAVAELAEAVQSAPTSDPVLCINFPSWLAPLSPTFAVGHEGIPLLSGYSNIGDLLWVNTGEERSVVGVVFHELQRHWSYHYVGEGTPYTSDTIQEPLRQVQRVIFTSYEGDNIALYDAGGLEGENSVPASEFLAGFDGKIGLISSTWEQRGPSLRVVLRWQSWEKLPQESTVFLHLFNSTGQLVAQADGYPLMNVSRPTWWRPGDQWRDVRVLQLPEGFRSGEYTIKIGLYPVTGGPRLSATNPAGQHFQDDAVPIAILTIP
jgi:hypothetical protein